MVETTDVYEAVNLIALTFTIGWLKRNTAQGMSKDFVPLTFTIGWLKHCSIDNSIAPYPFNFHHRVVETRKFGQTLFIIRALTFTIGWLKRQENKVCCYDCDIFNFHHRVVETPLYKKIIKRTVKL